MNKRNLILITDIIVYSIIIGFTIWAKFQSTKGYETFLYVMREDGWVEYLTTLFLALGAIGFGTYAVKAIKNKEGKKVLFYTLACLAFTFGTGEEISWGQRLFSIESSEYFMENNYQGETNLHNLEIGGVDLNKLIFSKLMFIGLIVYFILLPLLTWKLKFVRKLVIDFGVLLPRLHHLIVFFAVNIFIPLAINMKKESELHELALTGVMFLILINPAKSIKGVRLNYNK